jgi:hypothetical protein
MQVWTPNTQLQNGQYIIQKVISGSGFGDTVGWRKEGKWL